MRAKPYLLRALPLDQTLTVIVFVLSFLPTTCGLFVVSGSDCTAACFSNSTGSAYATNSTDVTCHDTDYSTTDAGKGFQTCVACEFQVPTFEHTTTQTDIGWALCKHWKKQIKVLILWLNLHISVNIRYTLSSCLYGFPNNNSVHKTEARPQCADSCSTLSDAIETNLATPSNATTYDYCHDSTFQSNVDACASCYNVVQNQRYLSNCKVHVLPLVIVF